MRRALFALLLAPAMAIAGEELRFEGFTDREIQEMKLVLQELTPGDIIYISGAKKGCNCEEGPDCTHQVRITTRYEKEDSNWSLSQINNHWELGRLLKWQRQYAAFMREYEQAKFSSASARREFVKANKERARLLQAQKPQCPEPAPNPSFKADAVPFTEYTVGRQRAALTLR